MPGVQSLPVEGAMYAFPQVTSAEVKAYQSKPVLQVFVSTKMTESGVLLVVYSKSE